MPKSYSQDLRARDRNGNIWRIPAGGGGAFRYRGEHGGQVDATPARDRPFGRQAAWRLHVASRGARRCDFGAAY
jgi:hypothetical protein